MDCSTLKSQRPHIVFFGCTNAGKSSVVNAITNQNLSLVSSIKGTTTDPVFKTMEILPIGAVVIVDTAGIDDDTELGELRTKKTDEVIRLSDLAVIVVDSTQNENKSIQELIAKLEKKNKKYLVVYNKSDLIKDKTKQSDGKLYISAKTGEGINTLKEVISSYVTKKEEKFIIKDKLSPSDVVILVIPIDESAPKGRIILPQQNTLREILDAHASAICAQVEELPELLNKITPNLVITDSQVFNKVKDIVPEYVKLTSFSILMANYKGRLKTFVDGVKKINDLQDGAVVLISEGCTHHRQCNDIGTVKLPKMIKNYTNKDIKFEFTQGNEFPSDLSKYDLIVHCGGCMLNEAEMNSRTDMAKEQNISITNYGILISYINGILNRSLQIFPEIKGL